MRLKYLIIPLFFLLILDVSAQKSKVKKFKQLSSPEKCWVICHPFVAKKALKITEEARKVTKSVMQEKLLSGNGNSGQIDAFRHAFWMASLTHEIGWKRAKKLGKAHEKGNYKTYKKGELEDGVLPDKAASDMDFFNNGVGIKIGRMTDTFEFKYLVIEAVKEGRCKIIKKDEVGNFLNCDGSIIPEEHLKGKWENEKCLVNSDD